MIVKKNAFKNCDYFHYELESYYLQEFSFMCDTNCSGNYKSGYRAIDVIVGTFLFVINYLPQLV